MMMRFTPTARTQLRVAVDRMALQDGAEAKAFVRALDDRLRNPDAARGVHPLPEFPEQPARETVVGSYRVFLREVSGGRWVIGVWPIDRTRDARSETC